MVREDMERAIVAISVYTGTAVAMAMIAVLLPIETKNRSLKVMLLLYCIPSFIIVFMQDKTR